MLVLFLKIPTTNTVADLDNMDRVITQMRARVFSFLLKPQKFGRVSFDQRTH